MITVDTADGVATICIDRPEKHNALTPQMRVDLENAFHRVQDDRDVRAVVLAGRGKSFCSGADIDAIGAGGVAGSMAAVTRAHRMIRALAGIEKPVIAAVEGACVGVGWSMALSCDYVIAAHDARFVFGFRNLGLAPDGAASFLLAQHVGLMRAKSIIYSAMPVSGREAAGQGLALETVEPGKAIAAALCHARPLASGPGLALAMAKRQFAAAPGQTLDQALTLEAAMVPLMTQTRDFAEGVSAFTERRSAQFEAA